LSPTRPTTGDSAGIGRVARVTISRMISCFDTSAINRLHDDPEREALCAGLLAAGPVRVTAVNVVELSATSTPARRLSLVRFAARLAAGVRPLAHPNTLLRASVSAFSRREPSVRVSVEGDEGEVWWALQNAEEIDDEAVLRIKGWQASQDRALNQPMEDARAQYEAMFRGSRWPRTEAEAIRGMLSGKEIYRKSLSQIFERVSGRPPGPEELEYLWYTMPTWRLYFMAWAYGVCARGMREEGYSLSKNAGLVDLTSACYLLQCTTFVTDDYRQYRALRLLSCFDEAPRCAAVLYDRFRRRLVLTTPIASAP